MNKIVKKYFLSFSRFFITFEVYLYLIKSWELKKKVKMHWNLLNSTLGFIILIIIIIIIMFFFRRNFVFLTSMNWSKRNLLESTVNRPTSIIKNCQKHIYLRRMPGSSKQLDYNFNKYSKPCRGILTRLVGT